MNSTARKNFEHKEDITLIKENLDVNTLNNFLVTSPEKAISMINYWKEKSINATEEAKIVCELEIRRLESLMLKMVDLTVDVYGVMASAYVDSTGISHEKPTENVITDDPKVTDEIKESSTATEEAPVISILTGDKVIEKPTLPELSAAVRSLLKKGNFDSANLLAGQYLSVGNYTPKKAKQEAVKWGEDKIASWIKDINANLMEEKRDVKKETKAVVEESEKVTTEKPTDVGLTTGEVEKLRLLTLIIPRAMEGHQDAQSRREVLESYMQLEKTVAAETTILNAVAKRIYDSYHGSFLRDADLANFYKDLDAFCKAFFAHRNYTAESVKAWREMVAKELEPKHFKTLRVDNAVDPTKLKKSGINYEQIQKRIKEEVEAGKTLIEITNDLMEGILYKEIPGPDKSSSMIYTKLHAKDLITSIHSEVSTKETKADPSVKTFIGGTKSDKVDIAEIKLLLTTIIENGGVIDDVKSHPEILGLINREIQNGENTPLMLFANEETLFPWVEIIFNELLTTVNVKVADVATELEKEDVDDNTTVSLKQMELLCETAAKSDVSQEDFILEYKDSIKNSKGGWKVMTDPADAKGGKVTLQFMTMQDFEKWVKNIYIIYQKPATEDKELVSSLKELNIKGREMLAKNTPYETFIEWLKANLLNRKLKEQKPGKEFKTLEAILSFAKSTFGNLLKKEVKTDKVGEPDSSVMTAESIIAKIREDSTAKNATFIKLARDLRELYLANKINVTDEMITVQQAIEITEGIVKESNPAVYADRMERKAKNEAKQAAIIIEETPVATVETDPVTTEESNVVEAEHQLFEKVDIASIDPALWNLIKNFKTLDEVYNMAVEFMEANKFNEALSMCLVIMPQITESKDWNAEQITMWFNTTILKPEATDDTDAKTVETKAEEVVTEKGSAEDNVFSEIAQSVSKKSFKRSIAAIFKDQADSPELRAQIMNAIKTGTGAHTRQVAKMPDGELHKMLNNIKEKASSSNESSEE